MAVAYVYVLDAVVAEYIFTLPKRQREQFAIIFRHLAGEPFHRGDLTFRDSSGREIQKGNFGSWAVSFWTDHAAKEVRIVAAQKIRR